MHDSMEQGGASVCVCGGVHASVCGWGREEVKGRMVEVESRGIKSGQLHQCGENGKGVLMKRWRGES